MTKFVATEKTKKELEAIYQSHLTSPWGPIQLQANGYGLCNLGLCATEEIKDGTAAKRKDPVEEGIVMVRDASEEAVEAAKAHIQETKNQLRQYFALQRDRFSLELSPYGTVFQRQVWQALLEVSYGHCCSYADIANGINNPKAVRAVGAANGANPIAIVVPCHRVIGKNGSMTGYAYGVDMKLDLLALEQQRVNAGK